MINILIPLLAALIGSIVGALTTNWFVNEAKKSDLKRNYIYRFNKLSIDLQIVSNIFNAYKEEKYLEAQNTSKLLPNIENANFLLEFPDESSLKVYAKAIKFYNKYYVWFENHTQPEKVVPEAKALEVEEIKDEINNHLKDMVIKLDVLLKHQYSL